MSEQPFSGLEPAEVWRHFAALTQIPRPPRSEERAREYVQSIAEASGATYKQDAKGNLVIQVPARGAESNSGAPVAAVQAHLDMVCVPDSGPHDVRTHPVQPVRNGEWIDTGGVSTLGADNGIGAAMALALLTTPDLTHEPLELLFTVEEEIGLFGALALESGFVTAPYLINLDSENPEELVVGCAGGGNVTISLPTATMPTPPLLVGRRLFVKGLKGGHSGIEIHLRRANAIQILLEALDTVTATEIQFAVAEIKGGVASNAIPTDAEVTIALDPDQVPALHVAVTEAQERFREEWGGDEPDFVIDKEVVPVPERVLMPDTRTHILQLLKALPHGVQAMSDKFAGVVETSCNLAMVQWAKATDADDETARPLQITVSCRSLVNSERDKLQSSIAQIAQQYSATPDIHSGYPGWDPNPNSRLLTQTVAAFEQVRGTSPEIVVIHAGAECGVILNKMPAGAEAISLGPRIEKPHTVKERVEIASIPPTWDLLTNLLASL